MFRFMDPKLNLHLPQGVQPNTLPETNSSPLKINGWKMNFLFVEWGYGYVGFREYMYQVIQAVTFLSTIVEGHDSPLKGSHKLTIPNRSRSQNCQVPPPMPPPRGNKALFRDDGG